MSAAKHREIASEAAVLCEPVHFYSTKFSGLLRPRSAIIVGGHADANVYTLAVFAGPDDDAQPVTIHAGVQLFESAAQRMSLNPNGDTWCMPVAASRAFLEHRAAEAAKQEKIAQEQRQRLSQMAAERAKAESDATGKAPKPPAKPKKGEQAAETPEDDDADGKTTAPAK